MLPASPSQKGGEASLFEMTRSIEKYLLQYATMMTVGFYTNRNLAGKEIRFTAASNAFSSLAYVVSGNGCRPSFSEIPYLPMILFWTKIPSIRVTGFLQGCETCVSSSPD